MNLTEQAHCTIFLAMLKGFNLVMCLLRKYASMFDIKCIRFQTHTVAQNTILRFPVTETLEFVLSFVFDDMAFVDSR